MISLSELFRKAGELIYGEPISDESGNPMPRNPPHGFQYMSPGGERYKWYQYDDGDSGFWYKSTGELVNPIILEEFPRNVGGGFEYADIVGDRWRFSGGIWFSIVDTTEDGYQYNSGYATGRGDRHNGRPHRVLTDSVWDHGYRAGWASTSSLLSVSSGYQGPTSSSISIGVSSSIGPQGYQGAPLHTSCESCGETNRKWHDFWYCPRCGHTDEDVTIYQYKVFCETENRDVFVWGFDPPRRCPHNARHTLDTNNAVIMTTVSPPQPEQPEQPLAAGGRVLNFGGDDE